MRHSLRTTTISTVSKNLITSFLSLAAILYSVTLLHPFSNTLALSNLNVFGFASIPTICFTISSKWNEVSSDMGADDKNVAILRYKLFKQR